MVDSEAAAEADGGTATGIRGGAGVGTVVAAGTEDEAGAAKGEDDADNVATDKGSDG